MTGKNIEIVTNNNMTIEDVKNEIQKYEGKLPYHPRLFFNGKELNDQCKLSDYRINNEDTLHLFSRFV